MKIDETNKDNTTSSEHNTLVLKELLSDIERKGIPLDSISLVHLCDKKPAIYGPPGRGSRRRWVQKQFDQLKNLKARNYLKRLSDHGVTPGPSTFDRIKKKEEEAEKQPTKATSTDQSVASIESASTKSEVEPESDSDSDESVHGDLPPQPRRKEETLQLQPQPSQPQPKQQKETAPRKKAKYTNNSKKVKANTPVLPTINNKEEVTNNTNSILDYLGEQFSALEISSPIQPTKMFSSPAIKKQLASLPKIRSPVPTAKIVSEEEQIDIDITTFFDFVHQDGTQEFPRIVMVNPDFPERNGPFFVSKLEKKEVGNFAFNGFHIALSVELPDYQEYKMCIPDPEEWPDLVPLLGRILLVLGPSLPFSQRYHVVYHRQNKVNCVVAKRVHEQVKGIIAKYPPCQKEFFFLIFGANVVLDNSIFSPNCNLTVSRNTNGIKVESNDQDVPNEFGRKFNLMNVWWEVAMAGGERIRASPTKKKADTSSLLD